MRKTLTTLGLAALMATAPTVSLDAEAQPRCTSGAVARPGASRGARSESRHPCGHYRYDRRGGGHRPADR
jgi:hypothetical protein